MNRNPLDANPIFRIVIPTINSSGWIRDLHHYYSSLNIHPLFVVDKRSTDTTIDILRDLGADVIELSGDLPAVESLMPHFMHHVDAEWIIRIDDDECPAKGLIDWAIDNLKYASYDVVGVSRRWLKLNLFGSVGYQASSSWDWVRSANGEDRQFRIYRKDKVEYTNRIHSHGFEISDVIYTPPQHCLYHMDWILRSKTERKQKMLKYEQITEGAGLGMAKFYLPEDVTRWDYAGEVLEVNVCKLARSLRNARIKRSIKNFLEV